LGTGLFPRQYRIFDVNKGGNGDGIYPEAFIVIPMEGKWREQLNDPYSEWNLFGRRRRKGEY